MPAKKPKPQAKQPKIPDNDVTIDISNYGAAQPTYSLGGGDTSIDLGYFATHSDYLTAHPPYNIDTITLPSNFSSGSITSPSTLTWSQPYDNYTISNTWDNSAKVNIGTDGIKIKEDGDLKIGDRSLKDFMDRVEDRLAILHPNEELEARWEQLKDLRRQYEALEKDILEKEKIMKILKEK